MKESYAVFTTVITKSKTMTSFDTIESAREFMERKSRIYQKRGYKLSGPPYRMVFDKKGFARIIMQIVKVSFVYE